MSASLALSSSLEDYLETIYWIVQDSQVARVKDIAKSLGVSKPSVTGALRALASKGLVNYDRYQYITLTDEGRQVAQKLARTTPPPPPPTP
jgi:DtxR family Mn-dependent transcriptional regulator